MLEIHSLLDKSFVKQDKDTIEKIILGVLASPKPKSKKQQFLWQNLFDANISEDVSIKLNYELDKLRENYNNGLVFGTPQNKRKSLVLDAISSLDLDANIITVTDEYQGEYLPDQARRLLWLTGFTGSAGLCVVGKIKSSIFVDGRYTVQVREEVNENDYEYRHLINDSLISWIINNYPKNSRIGFNPRIMCYSQATTIKKELANANIELVAVENDPIDMVWENQPSKPISPILKHPLKYAGIDTDEKYIKLKEILKLNAADAAVVCLPDSICWLLNIRGGDVPSTPFVHSYAIITRDNIHLFIEKLKIPNDLKLDVVIHGFEEFEEFLNINFADQVVLLDEFTVPFKIADILQKSGAKLKNKIDICQLPKSCKNDIEIQGARNAHIVDGVAMVKFLFWLNNNVYSNKITELDCSNKLTKIRLENPDLRDVSFDPISAVGSNGAICHYRVDEKSSKELTINSLYLIDSGGHYEYGTTDITRTIAIGEATEDQKNKATMVLKGLIALYRIRFPQGTSGMNLDILARQYLYQGGFNFDHGTGHGVGSYLSVHEGPGRIGINSSTIAFEPGMIYSNEPGYYKDGEYGIRLENLMVVTKANELDETPMMSFENLTWCPFDKNLINTNMLTNEEIEWVNNYHNITYKKISPFIDCDKTISWLKASTEEL